MRTYRLYVGAIAVGAILSIAGCNCQPSQTAASLSVSPANQSFGTVAKGSTSAPFTFTVSNTGQQTSGSMTTAIGGTNSADFAIATDGCNGTTLTGSGTCTVTITFKPSTGAAEQATFTVTASPGTSSTGTSATLTGTGNAMAAAALTLSPITNDFGTVNQGQTSSPSTFTVTNSGGSPSGAVTAAVSGTNSADFKISSNGCSAPIAANGNCTLQIKFSPSMTGSETATLTVTASPGTAAGGITATLTGAGAPPGTELSFGATTSLNFGNVVVNTTSADSTLTITNTGTVTTSAISDSIGGTNASQFGITTANDKCSGQTLAANASCTIALHFSPTSTGLQSAALTVTAATGGTVAASLSGTGISNAALSINPNFQSFGSIPLTQTSSAVTFTVTNTGGVATGALGAATLGGTNSAEFTVAGDGCHTQVLQAPGQGTNTCTITVTFTPTATGVQTATLSVSGTPGGMATANLQGTGVPAANISISPTTEVFPNEPVGTSSPAVTFTVTNATGAVSTGTLTTALSGADASQFQIVAGSNGCQGATLAGGASCTISVTFSPTAAGNLAASLSVSGSPGGSTSAALSGVALQPANLVIAPLSAAFGSVAQGQTSSKVNFTVTNSGQIASGTPAVTVTGANGGDFAVFANGCIAALAPNGNCTVTLTFTPTTQTAETASLNVQATPGGTATSSLSGTGVAPAQLSIVLTAVNYGTQFNGTSTGAFYVLCNGSYNINTMVCTGANGGQTTGPITLSVTGPNASEFAIAGAPPFPPCVSGTTTLTPSAICWVNVNFNPVTQGPKSATLNASATPGGATGSALSGVGENEVQVSGGGIMSNGTAASYPYAFGNQVIGSSTVVDFTFSEVEDCGTAFTPACPTTTLAAVVTGDTTEFVIAADTCTGTTLSGGSSCDVFIAFDPTTVANGKTASLTLTGAAPGNSDTVAMSGSAVSALTLTVENSSFSTNFGNVIVQGGLATELYTTACAPGVECGTINNDLSGANVSVFSVNSDNCAGADLGPASGVQACSFQVIFYPQVVGADAVTLTATGSNNFPGNSATLALTGNGVPGPALTLTPSSQSYGASVFVGQTPGLPHTFTVANAAGNATAGALSFSIGAGATGRSNPGDFVINNTGVTGACVSGTTVLAGGQSCQIQVYFQPQGTSVAGVLESATLSVIANPGATAPGVSAALTGTPATPLSISPTTNDYGTIQVNGSSADVTFTVTSQLPTGALAVTLSDSTDYAITPSSNNCGPGIATAGGTCHFGVHFSPQNLGNLNANLTVDDQSNTGSQVTATLTGFSATAPAFTVQTSNSTGPLTPVASTDFGGVQLTAASQSIVYTFTNTSDGISTGTLTTSLGNGAGSDFGIVSSTCTGVLAAGASCTVSVDFAPKHAGADTDTLTVTDMTATGTETLTGVGLTVNANLNLTPTPTSFPFTTTGGAPTANIVLTNQFAVQATLGTTTIGAPQSGNSVFSVKSNGCGATLAAGGNCTIVVQYAPTAPSALDTATLTVNYTNPVTATAASATADLRGSSEQQAVLAWNAATPTINFGSVAQGTSSGPSDPVTVVVKNLSSSAVSTGTISTAITGTNASQYSSSGCSGQTLAPGASCNLIVTFSPTQPQLVGTTTLTVSANPGGSLSTNLTGTDVPQALVTVTVGGNPVPATEAFGAIVVGNSGCQASANTNCHTVRGTEFINFAISNANGAATSGPITFTIGTTGQFVQPAGAGNPCSSGSTTLSSNQSCNLWVALAPTGNPAANITDTLTISATPGLATPVTVSLTGSSTSALTISPPSWAPTDTHACASNGGCSEQTFTVTNNSVVSTGPLSSVLGATVYTINDDTCAGRALGGVNSCGSAGGCNTCSVVVFFDPDQAGMNQAGTLTETATLNPAAPSTTAQATFNGTAN
jgi:hypothetical protein